MELENDKKIRNFYFFSYSVFTKHMIYMRDPD